MPSVVTASLCIELTLCIHVYVKKLVSLYLLQAENNVKQFYSISFVAVAV